MLRWHKNGTKKLNPIQKFQQKCQHFIRSAKFKGFWLVREACWVRPTYNNSQLSMPTDHYSLQRCSIFINTYERIVVDFMGLDCSKGIHNGHNPWFPVCIMTQSPQNETWKQEYLTNGTIYTQGIMMMCKWKGGSTREGITMWKLKGWMDKGHYDVEMKWWM